MSRSACAGLTLVAALVLASATASAQNGGDRARAKEAYDRGVVAHQRGDYPRAAREFAEADALAPSPVALQAALDAAIDADDFILGSELLERSARAAPAPTPRLTQSIDSARKRLSGRAGRVRVMCPAGATCSASLDGTPFDARKPTWAAVGPHTVVVQMDGEAQSKGVDVKAEESVDVEVAGARSRPAPAPAPAPAAPSGAQDGAGLPPLVFWVGLSVTALAGVAATYFMVDTRFRHEEFVDAGCEAGRASGCETLKDEGGTAQTTANVLLGTTAALAVATVVIGVVFTDWGGGSRSALRGLGPARGAGRGSGGALGYSLRF